MFSCCCAAFLFQLVPLPALAFCAVSGIAVVNNGSTVTVDKNALWFTTFFALCSIAGMITLQLNVRRRKALEKTLRRTEAQFRQLFNCADDAIYIHDAQGRLLEANQAACDRMGYGSEEMRALNVRDLSRSEDHPFVREQIAEILQRGRALFEAQHLTSQGHLIPVEVSANVIDYRGEHAVVCVVRDISKRKRDEEELHIQAKLLECEIAEHQLVEEALRVERNNFRVIFESAPVGMVLMDGEGGILSVNRSMRNLIGIQSLTPGVRMGEILACPQRLEHGAQCGETAACRACALHRGIQRALQFGEGEIGVEVQHDFLSIWREGPSWIRFSVEPIVLGGGRHLVLAFEDITPHKRMEARLRENETRLRLIFETSQAGILLIAPDGTIDYANSRMAEMFGCSLETLLGSPYNEHTHELERDSARAIFRRMVDGELSYVDAERRYLRKNGGEFIGYLAGRRLEKEDGTLQALVVSVIDISELKLAVDELQSEKERLAVTLRSIGDGVITTDTKGRVVLVNDVAQHLCGWMQEDAAGKPLDLVFRVIDEETRLPLDNPVVEVLSTGRTVELANRSLLVAADGSERSISDSASPILNDRGEIVGVVLVFRDITEKKQVEEELFKARKLESIGVLAGGIAHDFNNYLTAILGSISFARSMAPPDGRLSELLGKAETASSRAKELTQQLLTFAKGGAPVRRLAAMDQIVTDSAAFVLSGSNVRCEFAMDSGLYPVEVDVGQMSQVINNLVINASQAMPQGGVIRISAANEVVPEPGSATLAAGRYVRIVVEDQGVGISEAHLDRIFDPYFTTKEQGSGLGLATSYSIIRNHAGCIKVASRVGEGSLFTVHLPAADSDLRSLPGAPEQESLQGEGRILVMDDEEVIRQVISAILGNFGYQTTTSSDGAEACYLYQEAIAEGIPFDAVIMDITVPGGVGGKEAILKLKEIDPDVRAVVSSGYANDPIMSRYRECGFVAALSKPYSFSEIGAVLKEALAG